MDYLQTGKEKLSFSGERFKAVYRLTGSALEVETRAQEICIEQTIEFPPDLVGRTDIRDQVFGRVEAIRSRPGTEGVFEVEISYGVETVAGELTQLVNVLFGNISLKPGIRLVDVQLPVGLLKHFPGPRFGRSGLRELLVAPGRPLLCTALKPMGLSPVELADLAFRFALGEIDMIKDDHGLTDQVFCPFAERVARAAEAVAKANALTGRRCLYFPNITAPIDRILERARLAKRLGASGIMVAPGLVGLDTMRFLAAHPDIGLPVLSHPALQGTYSLRSADGISHRVLYGQFNRLAGADACIFPNYGGRFPFTRDDCRDLVSGTGCDMGHIGTIFPMPAGGLRLDRVAELIDFYGPDMILLIGGDLHRHGPDIGENCRKFARLAQQTRC